MKLVVGLGNPGRKYVGTRHNIGFEVIYELARRHQSGRAKAKFQGEFAEANLSGEKVIFLSPQTYMNNSGRCVQPAKEFYKIENDDVLIVCDDFNLDLNKLRFRMKGSAGGQKGLDDILRRLGTQEVPRLRFGVGTPPSGWDVADYVLSRFTKEEMPEVGVGIKSAANAVEDWITQGIDQCMNKYN